MGYFDSIYSDDSLPHRAKAVYMYLARGSAGRGYGGSLGICGYPAVRLNVLSGSWRKADIFKGTGENEKNGGWTSNLYLLKR